MYSEDNKRIEVYLETYQENGQEFWMTRVIDYGKGISDKIREAILNVSKVKGQRTGLGLAVTNQLLISFGGFLRIRNRVPDDFTKGTAVEIYLKKAS